MTTMSTTRYERLNNSKKNESHYTNDEEIDLDGDHRLITSGNNINGNISKSKTTSIAFQGSEFMQMAVGTLTIIFLYLSLSICLTFYQGALIKSLKFPFTIVVYHLIIKLTMSSCVRSMYKCRMGNSRVQLDWKTSLRKMAPTGIASGIDIGFSNWGFELVQISLYTITKSTTIIFILFFAILLGLEKKSWSLVFIVGLIATGLFMFTYKSTQFNPLGFTFLLIASLSSGIRWSFAQLVMQKSKLGLHNPVDMIYHMQPWMILPILPFSIYFEGDHLLNVIKLMPNTPVITIYTNIFKITLGAIIAFFMELTEFLVLSRTSSLTLSIAGIFKDIFQLALAVELNGDQLSLMNVLGLVVCLAGICCHLLHKYSMLTLPKNDDPQGNSSHDSQINKDLNISVNSNTTHSLSSYQTNSAQTIPLLINSDSDEDSKNIDDLNASEVIFDILKRRETHR